MAPSSNAGYLPLSGNGHGRPERLPFGRALLIWGTRKRGLMLAICVLSLIVTNLYVFAPETISKEKLQNLLGTDDWKQHFGFAQPEAPLSRPPADVPFVPVSTDSAGHLAHPEHPTLEDEKIYLHSSAFPAQLSSNQRVSMDDLYPAENPHKGQIPEKLLHILEAEPKRVPPPAPLPAPIITPDIFEQSVWTPALNGSTSTFEDSFRADKQPSNPDWRPAPFSDWQPPLADLAQSKSHKALPRVQFAFRAPSRHNGDFGNEEREQLLKTRQRLVRNAFLHAWEGYKRLAWGHDELKPVSQVPQDNFNGWGATIVDALDTLLVMDLPEEYNLAREHVRDIDFRIVGGERSAYGSGNGQIPVFETAIRYLGGFLSAYDLSGDTLMRDRAEELAQIIMPAFHTRSGVPVGRIRPGAKTTDRNTGSVVLAEVGSLLLEYTRLWQVTGNRTYFDQVQRTTDWLDKNMTTNGRLGSLFPVQIDPEQGNTYGVTSFGGMADSYYEYLIKEFQLLGGRLSQYGRMYAASIEDAKVHLLRNVDTVPGAQLLVLGQSHMGSFTAKLEHLACFAGGMLGLGSRLLDRVHDMPYARRVSETCWWAYNSTATGIGPEDVTFYQNTDDDRYDRVSDEEGGTRHGDARGNPIIGVKYMGTDYRNRPETIESVTYMWRITGDPVWQDRGWQMFSSWVTHSMTDVGFASLDDVTSVPSRKVDSMESFTYAETFKYYYLLFSPPDLISLDHYVFTTEAHPLLVPRDGLWTRPGKGPKSFWTAPPKTATEPAYRGGEGGRVGGGTNGQRHRLQRLYEAKKSHAHDRSVVRKELVGLGSAGKDAFRKAFSTLLGVDVAGPGKGAGLEERKAGDEGAVAERGDVSATEKRDVVDDPEPRADPGSGFGGMQRRRNFPPRPSREGLTTAEEPQSTVTADAEVPATESPTEDVAATLQELGSDVEDSARALAESIAGAAAAARVADHIFTAGERDEALRRAAAALSEIMGEGVQVVFRDPTEGAVGDAAGGQEKGATHDEAAAAAEAEKRDDEALYGECLA